MGCKNVRYINHLNEVTFIFVHREIIEQAKKISNPRIAGLLPSYELVVKDLEKVVHIPRQRLELGLNAKRISTYTSCRKAVESLKAFPPLGHENTVEVLAKAFSKSICRKSVLAASGVMDSAEQILLSVPREELEFLTLWERVEAFIKYNQDFRQSQKARMHNRRNRKKGVWYVSRNSCVLMFRCLMDLADNIAWLEGDEECKRFLAWANSP